MGVGPRLCCCGIVGDKERCSCGHETVFASAVRFPDRHGTRPVAARGGFVLPLVRVRVPCFGSGPLMVVFAVAMAQVCARSLSNPEAKAWHGDGTAPGRVWESNTPPQTFLSGFPVEPTLRETPPFYPVPDGIPLDGLAAPGRFFFAFSCRRSSGSSAAFITTRSDCAFPSPKQEFHVGASTNPCLAIGCLPTVVPVTSLFSYLRRKSTSDAFFLMLGIIGRLRAYVR